MAAVARFLDDRVARGELRLDDTDKAAACLLMMFQMDPGYALLSILVMAGIYLGLRSSRGRQDDLAEIFRGVMTQTTRYFQI